MCDGVGLSEAAAGRVPWPSQRGSACRTERDSDVLCEAGQIEAVQIETGDADGDRGGGGPTSQMETR